MDQTSDILNFSDMSGLKLKKSIGNIILKINADLLDLQAEYLKVKEGGNLSRKGEKLEKTVTERKDALHKALLELENRPEYIEQENMEKTVKMIKDNVATADTVLNKVSEVSVSTVQSAQKEATEALAEIDSMEKDNNTVISGLINNISRFASDSNEVIEVIGDDDG